MPEQGAVGSSNSCLLSHIGDEHAVAGGGRHSLKLEKGSTRQGAINGQRTIALKLAERVVQQWPKEAVNASGVEPKFR